MLGIQQEEIEIEQGDEFITEALLRNLYSKPKNLEIPADSAKN